METISEREGLARLALAMYAHEPCRICGGTITREEVKQARWAGYSADDKARSAHDACWQRRGNDDPATWAHP